MKKVDGAAVGLVDATDAALAGVPAVNDDRGPPYQPTAADLVKP
jgi:hypothetical protein